MKNAKSPWEGRLVRLRAVNVEDEPLVHGWFNDPEFLQHLSRRYPLSHQSEREFLTSRGDVHFYRPMFGIEAVEEGVLIGTTDLHDVNAENRSATLGIGIGDRQYRERGGYGTDAMRVLCRFGFEMMNLQRIELEVFAENERAQHVYTKVGFKEEARRREAVYKFGRYQDIVVMGLLAEELQWD